ncbi:hypothetical protein PGT21_014008 [Puccinia graminis f. sp. tritici]|uniref:Uncharacterized protein n=1 Tax=Puccinia graminis f. sp. tritici TaxID=56615 RepID=A0A5B0QAR1_PUCGR|nr:hypothetical protein PGT21_014008 [Puccinia graminis f. sp. tritici]
MVPPRKRLGDYASLDTEFWMGVEAGESLLHTEAEDLAQCLSREAELPIGFRRVTWQHRLGCETQSCRASGYPSWRKRHMLSARVASYRPPLVLSTTLLPSLLNVTSPSQQDFTYPLCGKNLLEGSVNVIDDSRSLFGQWI